MLKQATNRYSEHSAKLALSIIEFSWYLLGIRQLFWSCGLIKVLTPANCRSLKFRRFGCDIADFWRLLCCKVPLQLWCEISTLWRVGESEIAEAPMPSARRTSLVVIVQGLVVRRFAVFRIRVVNSRNVATGFFIVNVFHDFEWCEFLLDGSC